MSLLALGTGGASATPVSCTTSGSFDVTAGVVSNGHGGAGNCAGEAVIPSNVTRIDSSAFQGASNLAAVTFAAGSQLTSIGPSAFRNASSLTSITIPSGVTSIGTGAFAGATSLASVTFAAGSQLTSIGNAAFNNASSLTSIVIPSGVTSIGWDAFYNASRLARVFFAGDAPTVGGRAFVGVDLAVQAFRPPGSTGFTLSGNPPVWNGLPVSAGVACDTSGYFAVEGTTVVGNAYCVGSPELPGGVTRIGVGAFYGATGLTSITIPSTVTSIGSTAFWGASGLTSVVFEPGSRLEAIGDYVFFGAENLRAIVIPASVPSIGDSAFRGASSLASVTFAAGSRLERIGVQAFQETTSLTSITIPKSVTSVGPYAFNGASGLTTVAFEPGSVLESIDDGAFVQASSLTSIVIPSSVTRIGLGAFDGATGLASVIFEGNAPAVGDAAFLDVAEGATAYRSAPATGFDVSGDPPRWNGLRVAVYLATPPAPVATAGELSATVAAQAAATGPVASSLVVTASPGGASCVISGSSGSCTVTGLTAGTAYTFTAVARSTSPSSQSEVSAASAAVTPTAPPAKPATVTLRTAAPTVVANGVAVAFTASGPGTATASGVVAGAKRGVRAGTVVCSGTLRVKKAGKVRLVCVLNAAGRKLRTKGALKVVLTTRFVPTKGTAAVSTRTVTIPRKR